VGGPPVYLFLSFLKMEVEDYLGIGDVLGLLNFNNSTFLADLLGA
jgi:hypothetical protein